MFKEIINKHATLFLKDGAILVGFVVAADENYIKLIELSNEVVIQSLDEVSTVRTGVKQVEKKPEKPMCFSVASKKPVMPEEYFPPTSEEEYFPSVKLDEFAMVNSVYKSPTFIRKTDDIKEED